MKLSLEGQQACTLSIATKPKPLIPGTMGSLGDKLALYYISYCPMAGCVAWSSVHGAKHRRMWKGSCTSLRSVGRTETGGKCALQGLKKLVACWHGCFAAGGR